MPKLIFREDHEVEPILVLEDLSGQTWTRLAYEAGLQPESILPDAPEVAAWVSGFFAARAGLPAIPDAPQVRQVQRRQLQTALPWATRALDLAPSCL
jgi:hypothetical protein